MSTAAFPGHEEGSGNGDPSPHHIQLICSMQMVQELQLVWNAAVSVLTEISRQEHKTPVMFCQNMRPNQVQDVIE